MFTIFNILGEGSYLITGSSMRVVVVGHTGIEKDIVVGNLINHIYSWKGFSAGGHQSEPFLAPSYKLEQIISQQIGGGYTVSLLEAANPQYAYEQWAKAFQQIYEDVKKRDPEHAILQMHLTFHVPGRALFPWEISHLEAFHTTHIITLIDDLYETQARIKRKSEQEGTNYKLSLRELAWWRKQEIGMAAWIARSLPKSPVERGGDPQPVQHYVVAVKHPIEMVRRLLFEPQRPRVYISFPITSARRSKKCRKEIDRVRERLHSLHTVFDPLTIDELSPWVMSKVKKGEPSISIDEGNPLSRWPIPIDGTLAQGRENVYPIILDAQEVKDVKASVEHSIRMRDFGLVDSCDHIIGYRPSYKKKTSLGMFAEFHHAQNVCRPPVPIHFYSPDVDDIESSPFTQFRIKHEDEDRWWEVVENLSPRGR